MCIFTIITEANNCFSIISLVKQKLFEVKIVCLYSSTLYQHNFSPIVNKTIKHQNDFHWRPF